MDISPQEIQEYLTVWNIVSGLLPIAPSAAILFFLWKAGLIKFRGENGEKKYEIPDWAQKLTMHFNEETTEILRDIRNGIEKLDDRGEKSCRKLDAIINHHENLKEFGVKIQKNT